MIAFCQKWVNFDLMEISKYFTDISEMTLPSKETVHLLFKNVHIVDICAGFSFM